MSDVILEMAEKMEKSVEAFKNELAKVRTGRASLALLDGIQVEAYGSAMPLNQVGTLTIPESRTIAIQPWDPQVLGAIEKAILKSDVGLTPANDGKIIRLNIPQLTEERRKELVKQVKKNHKKIDVLLNNAGVASMNHIITTPGTSLRKTPPTSTNIACPRQRPKITASREVMLPSPTLSRDPDAQPPERTMPTPKTQPAISIWMPKGAA